MSCTKKISTVWTETEEAEKDTNDSRRAYKQDHFLHVHSSMSERIKNRNRARQWAHTNIEIYAKKVANDVWKKEWNKWRNIICVYVSMCEMTVALLVQNDRRRIVKSWDTCAGYVYSKQSGYETWVRFYLLILRGILWLSFTDTRHIYIRITRVLCMRLVEHIYFASIQ